MERLSYLLEVFWPILFLLMGTFRTYYAIKDKKTLGYFDKTFIVLFIIGTPILVVNIYSAISHHNVPQLRLVTIFVSCIVALIVGIHYEHQNSKRDAGSKSEK